MKAMFRTACVSFLSVFLCLSPALGYLQEEDGTGDVSKVKLLSLDCDFMFGDADGTNYLLNYECGSEVEVDFNIGYDAMWDISSGFLVFPPQENLDPIGGNIELVATAR